jgi:asparagine synthase (glutamine-hydrolysing)
MCGITGKIYFDPLRNVDTSEIKRMTDSIIHRGPDDEGIYINNNIGLGFRRLSIIDLKSGHQPLSNSDNSLWITFNGEIYNYRELRSNLAKMGYKFNTMTDTEVILNLYAKYGEDCLEYLRGMFAFVIWDDREKKLFGARDRFGIKPFYYYKDENQFVWGSEIKAILASEEIEKNVNLHSLDDYLTYGYIQKDRSIYSFINKIEPGHCFSIKPLENTKLRIRKYWDIDFRPDYSKSTEEWIELLQNGFKESVKLRLVSDVPLGAFLSGGIDSSSVVAQMASVSDKPIQTFSMGFKESKYNELKYAKLVAQKYNTKHSEFIVEPESVGLLDKLVNAYDEPFADSSAIPTYYVSKFARQNVTVALSGDGGDELFAGYKRYNKMLKLHNRPMNYSAINKSIIKLLFKALPNSFAGKGLLYYLSLCSENLPAYQGIFKPYERKKMYTSEIVDLLDGKFSEMYKIDLISKMDFDYITKMQATDIKTYLVDDILTKVDRVSMANSLEVRVPMLDHKFFELSANIPSSLKLNENGQKDIFKKAMAPFLPNQIIEHRKQGFAVPLSMWFKDELKEYISDTLLGHNSKISSIINRNYLVKLVKDHNVGMRDLSSKIWALLFLETWLQQNKISI